MEVFDKYLPIVLDEMCSSSPQKFSRVFSMSLSNVKVTNVFQRKWPRNEWITFFPWDIKCYQMVLHKIVKTLLQTSQFLSKNPILRIWLIISFANWSLVKNLYLSNEFGPYWIFGHIIYSQSSSYDSYLTNQVLV